MAVGERLRQRLDEMGMSQSALARAVSLNQSTIAALIAGRARSSAHLHKIARALGTTPAFLEGETDDPSENAPPPLAAPRYQALTLQVLLPSEAALARMFEGILRAMPEGAPLDAQALLLAKRLPIGLSQLRDLLPDQVPADRRPARPPEAHATPDHESPQ